MGYGFSIPNNKADAFALALSSRGSTETLNEPRLNKPGVIGDNKEASNLCNLSSDSESRKQTSDDLQASPSSKIFHIQPDPESSLGISNQSMLHALSIMVANRRELREIQTNPDGVTVMSHASHNQAMIACQLLSVLRYQLGKITRYDKELPTTPQNVKQIYAAEYRRSQTCILQTIITSLESFLDTIISHGHYVVSLEKILISSPLSFIAPFRAAIHHTLRTRNPDKIRNDGYQDLVFTVWVCTLFMCCNDDTQSLYDSTDSFHKRLRNWVRFLRKVYGSPPNWSKDLSKDEDSNRVANTRDPESLVVVSTYLSVISSFATKCPESLYADSRWTVEFLQYGFSIVQEEGVLYPSLTSTDGEEGDFMIFLEECDAGA